MEITGTQTLPASRQKVWDALNDPDILKKCLPGCESVEQTNDTEYKVVIAATIGPLRARFNGRLRMTEMSPPSSCTMVFEGQGGPVGFGKGSSVVRLEQAPNGTELSYTAKAEVGGKLAQVGSRLIDNVARKMADDFFNSFKKQLSAPGENLAESASHAAPTPLSVAKETATSAMPGHAHKATSVPQQNGTVMVPGWWLLVATALGSILTVVGTLLVR